MASRRKERLQYHARIFLLALLVGLPGSGLALLLLWTGDFGLRLRLWASALLLLFWWSLAWTLRERVIRPLQTLSNILAALLEGDYSIRSRLGDVPDDPLGLAMAEVNALARTLREQRLGALEATALLRKVIEETDVAMFAFDEGGVLRLVNRAGERLLAAPSERLLGRT
ncbi:MAG TPA: PAS domain-containing protein, partial [Longimicrobiales bacterium]